MWRCGPYRAGSGVWTFWGVLIAITSTAVALAQRPTPTRPGGHWRSLTGQDAPGIVDLPSRHGRHPCPGGGARYDRYDSIKAGPKGHWYVWERGRQGLLDGQGQLVVACAYDSARPVAGQTYAVYRGGQGQLLAGTAPLQDSLGAIRHLGVGQAIWQAGTTWWAHDSASGSLLTLPGQVRGHYRRGVWLSSPLPGGRVQWQLMALPTRPNQPPLLITGAAPAVGPKGGKSSTQTTKPKTQGFPGQVEGVSGGKSASPRYFPAGNWALVQSGRQTYLMGPTGQWRTAVLPILDTLLPVRDGLMAFRSQGSWGFLDTLGYIRMSARYAAAGSFLDGAAAIKIGRRWGLINRADELVSQPVYDTLFALGHGWHWGIKEGAAHLVRPGQSQRMGSVQGRPPVVTPGGFIVGQGGLNGFIDKQGQMILPVAYEHIECLPGGAILVHAQQRWRLYTDTGAERCAYMPGYARYDPCRQALYVERAISP